MAMFDIAEQKWPKVIQMEINCNGSGNLRQGHAWTRDETNQSVNRYTVQVTSCRYADTWWRLLTCFPSATNFTLWSKLLTNVNNKKHLLMRSAKTNKESTGNWLELAAKNAKTSLSLQANHRHKRTSLPRIEAFFTLHCFLWRHHRSERKLTVNLLRHGHYKSNTRSSTVRVSRISCCLQ